MLLLLLTLLSSLLSQATGTCPSPLSSCYCGATTVICNNAGVGISVVKEALVSSQFRTTITLLSIAHFTDTVLPQYYVTDFPQLRILILQSGQLNTIVPGAFANASNLQQIDLRYNRLTWISGEMFEGVTSNLTRFQLNNNRISQLFSDLVSIFNLMPNVAGSQISLNENNLNCSCQLQWLNDFIISGNSRSINGATCTYSNESSQVLGLSLNFTECLDLCLLGYYSCPTNTTCIPLQQNQTYGCVVNQQITPSPSMLEFFDTFYYSLIQLETSTSFIPYTLLTILHESSTSVSVLVIPSSSGPSITLMSIKTLILPSVTTSNTVSTTASTASSSSIVFIVSGVVGVLIIIIIIIIIIIMIIIVTLVVKKQRGNSNIKATMYSTDGATPTYLEIIDKPTTTAPVPIYDTPMETDININVHTNTAYQRSIDVHNNAAYGQIMM